MGEPQWDYDKLLWEYEELKKKLIALKQKPEIKIETCVDGCHYTSEYKVALKKEQKSDHIPDVTKKVEPIELIEILAELAHSQWSGWIEYMFSKCPVYKSGQVQAEDGALIIPKWAVDRWRQQSQQTYKELSVDEKNSDRTEADKFLKVFQVEIDRLEAELKTYEAGNVPTHEIITDSETLAVQNELLITEIEALEAENRWIAVEEGLPNTNKNMEFCWRPIDYIKRPQHIEVVVGTFCYRDERGNSVGTPTRVWVSGRYYDIKTHITHYRYIVLPKERQ